MMLTNATIPPRPAWQHPDLHCHSCFSDGTLTPEELAFMAQENGVDLWALTDHDSLDGIPRAQTAAAQHGIAFLAGVEISVSFLTETVHIVGLGVDPNNTTLQKGLASVRRDRLGRAQRMGDELAKAGIAGAFEGALRFVRNPDLVSRAHFARYIVEQGLCKHTQDVFNRYLTPGKPGYVEHAWASLNDALHWIHDAKGVAVLAHPGRYRLTPAQRDELLDAFCALGGQAVEVVTGSHRLSDVQTFTQIALKRQLLASTGSDFHDRRESKTHLGQCAALSTQLTPVWSVLHDRIQWPTPA